MPDRVQNRAMRRNESAAVSRRGIIVRLFLTCWIIYSLHFATNIVREIYLALTIGEHLSFRVDEYAHLHSDLFEMPGRGWHINNNPGASMLAAVPYAAAAPVINELVTRVNARRGASGAQPPKFDSPWPLAREFHDKTWRRGLDIKFGLAAMVMQVFLMAPLSAGAAVLMFGLLSRRGLTDRQALLLSFLFAFGTPIFFRTGFLNQNALVAHCALAGIWALDRIAERRGALLAGLAGGCAVLMDYSGVVILGCFGLYLLRVRVQQVLWFACGASGPILLLWFYQWSSFGNPFLPAQQYMTATALSGAGYSGVTLPQLGLAWANLFDYRYGLFVSCPLLLLSLGLPFLRNKQIRREETVFLLGSSVLFLIFIAMVQYSRLQFNSGVRYMVAVVPFLFLALVPVMARIPRRLAIVLAVLAVGQAWCMAMYRDVERGNGALEPLLHVASEGLQLPALTTAQRGGYGAPPAYAVIAAAMVVVAAIWWRAFPRPNGAPPGLRN